MIRFGFIGGQNLMLELADQLGKSGEADFQARGGHRLWSAPERHPRTYYPDNHPLEVEIHGSSITLTSPVEQTTGLRKEIMIRLAGVGGAATLVHRIENTLDWPIEVLGLGLDDDGAGRNGISGFPPRGSHPEMLPPSNPLVMWAFTDLSDPRWRFTRKYMLLHHDSQRPEPTKLGHFSRETWGAYLLGEELFIKRH